MKIKLISIVLFSIMLNLVWGREPEYKIKNTGNKTQLVPRENCAPATKQIDQDINNVRARLLNGGDCWNDLAGGNNRKGRYIVPKVDPGSGKPEVSSLYSGAVWVGGRDPSGALKFMGQTFRQANENDCWPGPLTDTGSISTQTCLDWDRFFRVSGDNIRTLIRKVNASPNKSIPISEVPEDLRYFPCRGNKEFEAFYKFALPNTNAGLALFNDKNENRSYEPELGEYPTIDIKGCPNDIFPDDMIFWIYNDNGGIHTNSRGEAIRMEVQVQAFAFRTADELNDMTFQRYKLINRAPREINQCYFAMWIDPDLGCHTDDYIGCDTSWTGKYDSTAFKRNPANPLRRILRDFMYIYNIDAADGSNGCTCEQNVNTYCNDVPIIGVDYFRGPLDENGDELGMSYFMYYNRGGGGQNQNTTDPVGSEEFYRYITGRWKDGTALTVGGTGYNPGSIDTTRYAFPSPPDNPNGWSMCSRAIGEGDRRTIQATGPLKLLPGAKNELIIGVPWVPDQTYPCPSLDEILKADQLCQDLFDNCFELKDGPDAPNVDFVELDRELVLMISNQEGSNNFNEEYAAEGLGFPPNVDNLYRFEGYRVFQVADANTSLTEANIADPSKIREIFTVDLKNSISKVYNWVGVKNPNPSPTHPIVYYPQVKVEGLNSGIRHSFNIKEDAFATGINKRLINHQKYYFIVLAYAYNNYTDYNVEMNAGQRTQYCPGRLNLGPAGDGRPYIATPRPLRYEVPRTNYGDGVTIIRHDGVGTGDNFLRLADGMYDKILSPNFDNKIEYAPGGGPVEIKIVNPLKVKDGEFELKFSDSNLSDNKLDSNTTWSIKGITDPNISINSTGSIALLNDQIIRDLGIAVTIGQVPDAGVDPFDNPRNGVIGNGLQYTYKNENGIRWFAAQPERNIQQINFIKTELGAKWNLLDPNGEYEKLGSGILQGTWYPYKLVSGDSLNISPAWMHPTNLTVVNALQLHELNNVDIVFTSDKSKWSRCIVVETWNRNNIEPSTEISPTSSLKSFNVKENLLSVGKNDADGDGKADPDGEKDASGKNLTGMGWFPGYAIDVETGTRLNIFFGENSFYSPQNGVDIDSCLLNGGTGNDLMWNPTSQLFLTERFGSLGAGCGLQNSFLNLVLGGHHYIYVTRTKYDGCSQLRTDLIASKNTPARTIRPLRENLTWCSMPVLFDNFTRLNALGNGPDGLIPNDLTVSLRVRNPYNVEKGTNENQGHNLYRFKIENKSAEIVTNKDEYIDAMRDINVVPNPYYAYSAYETGQFSNIVKITNLPAKCNVTIYSLDGKFIKQYKRDEKPVKIEDKTRSVTEFQVAPDLEWDLTNFKNIPIASGTYLIHVEQPETGAVKIIKWFGVVRKFDPSGL